MAFFFDDTKLWNFIRANRKYLVLCECLPELLDDFLEAAQSAEPGARFDLLTDELLQGKLAPDRARLTNWVESYTYRFSDGGRIEINNDDLTSILSFPYSGIIVCTKDNLAFRAANLRESSQVLLGAFKLAGALNAVPVLGMDRFGTAIDYREPLPGHAALRLAQAHRSAGDLPEAIRHLRLELVRFPDDAIVQRQLVHTLLDIRQPLFALQAVRDWIEHSASHEWAHYEAARAHMQLGKDREALELLHEEENRFPGKSEIVERIAEVSVRLGLNEEAIQSYEELAFLQPDRHQLLLELARLCKVCGRETESIRHLADALKLAPGDARVIEAARELGVTSGSSKIGKEIKLTV